MSTHGWSWTIWVSSSNQARISPSTRWWNHWQCQGSRRRWPPCRLLYIDATGYYVSCGGPMSSFVQAYCSRWWIQCQCGRQDNGFTTLASWCQNMCVSCRHHSLHLSTTPHSASQTYASGEVGAWWTNIGSVLIHMDMSRGDRMSGCQIRWAVWVN